MSVLSLQKKISVSGHMFSPIWVQFEPLRFLGYLWFLCAEFYLRGFSFVVNVYILMVMKRKLKGTCMQLSRIFGLLMTMMGMKSEKIILKISSVISPWHVSRSANIPNWNWLEKFIGSRKIIISTIEVGLSYKIFFVLGVLHTSKGHNSAIWSLNVRRFSLAGWIFYKVRR